MGQKHPMAEGDRFIHIELKAPVKELQRGHFDPTTSEYFRDLASPDHCLWQWLWRSKGAIMVAGKLTVRWFPPERYRDVAVVALTRSPPPTLTNR